MELLILVVGIVLVWKFSSVLNAWAKGAQTTAEVFSEEVIMNAVEKRTDQVEIFKEKMGDKEIKSHEEIMSMLKMK